MPHDALIAHLLEHSVRRGDFILKSGKPSSWFIDAKQTTCRPEGMLLVADAALAELPDEVTAIGGLTMGADAVAFGIAAIAATRGRHLRSFSVRKEVKDHGGGGRIAGALDPGDKVVITEDAVTRGTSLMEAVEVVREAGAEPILVLALVDRGGTCRAMADAAGVPFRALVTALDLGFDYETWTTSFRLSEQPSRAAKAAPIRKARSRLAQMQRASSLPSRCTTQWSPTADTRIVSILCLPRERCPTAGMVPAE